MNPLSILALVLCAVSAAVANILHFQMKFRLYNAGLPVKWFMMPSDDLRMWRTYLVEAPRRQWPVWPFYVYRVIIVLFIASGLVLFLNIGRSVRYFGGSVSGAGGAPFMRLDRHDIFPLTVVLLFGVVIPLGLCLGFGTPQQIAHDFFGAAKTFTIASIAFAVLIGCLSIIARRREKRILAERGEQSSADFVAQFTSEPERRAAILVFDTLRELSAVKRMPRLERDDQVTGPPLFLAQEDLEERMEMLSEKLDFSLWLDPDGASALYSAKTVEQLVLALAHFIEQQGASPALIGNSDW